MSDANELSDAPATVPRHAVRRRGRSSRRGSVMLWCIMSMSVVGGIAALSFDMSRLRSAKGELQAAADAAALNGANGLGDNTYFTKAQAAANDNKCDGTTITLVSANVVPGNWTGTTFTANGSPRNALKVIASRTGAGGNAVQCYISGLIGQSQANVQATAIVALVKQADYTWSSVTSTTLNATNNAFKVSSYDATNVALPEQKTSINSNGNITVSGSATINADVKYGTSTTIAPAATVTGTISLQATSSTYPPGSQVANLAGVVPVYATTADQNVASNMTLAGGTYVIRNFSVANCTISFTGPATVVFDGNMSLNNCGFVSYGNLPANLKIISSGSGTTMNIVNLTAPLVADFYAPNSSLSMSTANGYYGLKGRGVFQSMSVSGAGANSALMYDRSMTSTSLSQKAVVVR